MPESSQSALEIVLRLCGAAAPAPWYPRPWAARHGIDRETTDRLLEELWLDGLIEREDQSPEHGPGLALSERGRAVLQDESALERLRSGRPLVEGDRGGIVRQAVRA